MRTSVEPAAGGFLLEVVDLEKSYSGRTVIKAAHAGFRQGAVTAVCGPNGSGKSTLLRILALLDYPDRGRVVFRGRPLTSRGDWFRGRKSITMVDQHPYAFPGSVHHNVSYGLGLRGRDRDRTDEKVCEVLSLVGLSGMERRRAGTLSGGELQRMAMARAMVFDPEVLILDEPTAHVDAARVREVEDLVRRLREERGMTIVLATHDHAQADRLADRVLEIKDGALEEEERIFKAGLVAGEPALIKAPGRWKGPGTARVLAAEVCGKEVLVRLEGRLPLLRVSAEDYRAAGIIPGDRVRIEKGD